MKPETLLKIGDKEFELFVPFPEISEKTAALGTELNRDYTGLSPVFIPVLNGSFMFASDLIREVCIPCEVSFVKTASYDGLQSTGKVQQVFGADENLRGRHLILVEDIVDTGQTVAALLSELRKYEPASIEVVTLFFKPDAFKGNFPVRYRGFEIPEKFIVGYGLDYRGLGRNYRDVYSLYSPAV
jgi:hypoxanthine phosphoribosyltransferase